MTTMMVKYDTLDLNVYLSLVVRSRLVTNKQTNLIDAGAFLLL